MIIILLKKNEKTRYMSFLTKVIAIYNNNKIGCYYYNNK